MNEENEFLRHEGCDNCGSSDAKAVYSDGGSYCFSCHNHTFGDGDTNYVQTNNHKVDTIDLRGSAEPLVKRKISQKTCEKFKALTDGDLLRFYYYEDNRPVGAKVRTKDKQFSFEGKSGSLYGMQLFKPKGKRVVVVEGEIDALAVYESQPWPVVSIPHGAASAKKSIKHNFEWLCGFDKVVLFFDNDGPGKEAAIDAASVLPPGKAFIGHLEGYKDASEALMAGDTDAIRAVCNYDHTQYRPDGIVDGKSLFNLVTTPTTPSDHDYGFTGLQRKLHGIRYGELVTITAGSGIGKSSFCRQLAVDLLNKGERVGYLALEESNRRTALGLMSVHEGKPLHLGEYEPKYLTEAYERTLANWNLFLFDGFGSYDPDIIYNRIEYLASGLDCKIIFLDHLSILLSGLDGDERRMIDTTMTKLRALTERTGISLFLVSHLRRTSGNDKNHEEGARVTLGQLRGSAAIAQLSDGVIGLERDQQSSSDGNNTTVRVLKNRYSGEVGIACTLSYDLINCKFTEHEIEPEFDPTTDF